MSGNDTVNVEDFPPGIVGVPVEDWMWSDAAWALQQLALPPRSRHIWSRGGSTIASKRNHIVGRFLEDPDAEWLLFVDSDQTPPRVAALQLLSVGEGIVSGLIFGRVPPHLPCCGHTDADGRASPLQKISPRTTPIVEVDWVGAGCILIRRRVLEALEEPYFEHTEPGAGEDTYFCRKAREAGFNLYVDTRLDVGHIGSTAVDADYARTWYRTEKAGRLRDGSYSKERGWGAGQRVQETA